MATKDVQSPIQLAGRGAVFRANDNYEPGEYKWATNVVLDRNGTLVPRPPVQGYWDENNLNEVLGHFAGTFGSDPIFSVFNGDIYRASIVSYKRCSTIAERGAFGSLAVSVHPLGATGLSKVATVVGYTIYNNAIYYMVVCSFRPAATNDRIVFLTVMKGPLSSFLVAPSLATVTTAGAQVISSVTLTGIYSGSLSTFYTNNKYLPTTFVKDWLIHKDRLWIGIGDTMYFSEAGNPQNFVAPLGGFTTFPQNSVVSLSALGDTIYNITDSRIYAVSYGEDFNVDGQVTLVSDVIGGKDSVTYGDGVYVVGSESLYRIDGLNVSKILDLEVIRYNQRRINLSHDNSSFTGGQVPDYKLVAFEDSLFIIQRFIKPIILDPNAVTPFDIRYDISAPIDSAGDNFNGPSCIGINMTNGFVTNYFWGTNGEAYDAIFVPVNDSFNQSRLFFLGAQQQPFTVIDSTVFSMGSNPILVTDYTSPTNPVTSSTVGNFNIDSFQSPTNLSALQYEVPGVAIAFVNQSPDDIRHVIKKIRTLEIEGSPPYITKSDGTQTPLLWLYVFAGANFEDSLSSDPSDMNGLILSTQWLPALGEDVEDINEISRRYGINQRMRRFSLVICTKSPDLGILPSKPVPLGASYQATVLANPVRTMWDISNIQTRWTYTDRAGTNLNKDLS